MSGVLLERECGYVTDIEINGLIAATVGEALEEAKYPAGLTSTAAEFSGRLAARSSLCDLQPEL